MELRQGVWEAAPGKIKLWHGEECWVETGDIIDFYETVSGGAVIVKITPAAEKSKVVGH